MMNQFKHGAVRAGRWHAAFYESGDGSVKVELDGAGEQTLVLEVSEAQDLRNVLLRLLERKDDDQSLV